MQITLEKGYDESTLSFCIRIIGHLMRIHLLDDLRNTIIRGSECLFIHTFKIV